MTTNQKSSGSTVALLKTATEKLATAQSELASAKKKVSKWSDAVDHLTIQRQKEQLAELGVSDAVSFTALVEAAKRGGFKSPSAPSAPAPVPAKPAAPVSPPPGRG